MKINRNFILRQVAGESILIPTGQAALDVQGLIRLSESGALLYQKLSDSCTEEELVSALMQEYEVDGTQAARDVKEFLDKMRALSVLED